MTVSELSKQIQPICYKEIPEKDKLLKIAKLSANAFAGPPWNEYIYSEEEIANYIAQEVSTPDSTLITFEDESGEVLAAGWGYTCTSEMLQAKYSSLEMKEKVVSKAMMTAQKIFYLSEIMVDPEKRGQGLATQITIHLLETAQSLKLSSVMRTRGDSPMVKIANKMQMTQVISIGEDIDNLDRVLFITRKIQ
jgi:ribosomal protein S18 acetylase RimI-like enzyme